MRWLSRLRRRVRLVVHRATVEREMEDEIRFHLEMESEELARFGVPDSQRVARRRFGGVARYQDEARDARGGRCLEELRQDARYAGRMLRHGPGFATVAILTLALGIGANTAIFSVVRGVLLRELPYADPERLVAVRSVIRGTPTAVSPPDFFDWRATARSMSGLSAFFLSTTNLTGLGEAERLTQARVSANFFDLIGVQPALGRGFRAEEEQSSAARVAVLSDGLWRRRFGAERSVIGRTISLDDQPTTIVGIAPPQLRLPAAVDLWLTTRFSAKDIAASARGARWIDVIGRLSSGATLDRARAEMNAIASRLALADSKHNNGVTAVVLPLRDVLVGRIRTPLFVLLGAVGFVMLIVCVNVASLSLGRAAARETELAVRVALGASRARIVRQMLTESLILSVLGGVVGIAIAMVTTPVLVALAPGDLPLAGVVRVDGAVLAFAVAVTVLSGVLFGVVPAAHGARRDTQERLRAGGRGASHSAGGRARRVLVVAEIALAITLLAGAGLLLRSLGRLTAVDPGFRSADVTTFSFALSPLRYPGATEQSNFASELLSRLGALPGVTSVGISFDLPLSNTGFGFTFVIGGRPEKSGPDEPRAQVRITTPDYFRTMGIPLVRGRGFTAADRAGASPVILISEEAARRYWPNEDPIGSTISTGWGHFGKLFGGTVIGVVGDVRQFGLADAPTPHMYGPLAQWPLDELSVVVRSNAPPTTVIAAARDVVRTLDAQLPVYDAFPLEKLVRESIAARRFYTVLLATFAVLALLLAAIGIYGVIAYSVQQRRRELGIRIALGASRERVLAMVMRQGMSLAIVGAALGLGGAALLTRVLSGQLFGVSVTDPLTFASVAVLLLGVALVACIVPARRAVAVDPASTIRAES